ncbi:hypothetical protein PFICI_01752 [Pestalotiopsis fici W106-1]|uniref:Uncharacterized protein n=1 Tax=Pestalotiopsis fici (strain W106-1 / CGMCC3.15140) TaxID=1229662 RepID=W3XPM1_PESFW|nr:uncharacterized protein PFICI_01752 [Pestalotiopsis fici W106-1]ETS87924.1 hypothetical protein PFICI_01752 [Pestalotiopsis fici W106-1]
MAAPELNGTGPLKILDGDLDPRCVCECKLYADASVEAYQRMLDNATDHKVMEESSMKKLRVMTQAIIHVLHARHDFEKLKAKACFGIKEPESGTVVTSRVVAVYVDFPPSAGTDVEERFEGVEDSELERDGFFSNLHGILTRNTIKALADLGNDYLYRECYFSVRVPSKSIFLGNISRARNGGFKIDEISTETDRVIDMEIMTNWTHPQ